MIIFREVVHGFGKKTPFGDHRKTVLNGVDFHINRGEIICLLGPSGCGKTTMVNLIMGRLLPSEGTVTVMGEQAPYTKARKSIGYMPQEDALYDDITARENLEFFGAMNGMRRSEIQKRSREVLAFARLDNDADKLVAEFSGGMKRRLSLGIALLHDPALLVLDEPTVGLDPDHRRRIWDRFDQMVAAGKTILVTTHVMEEAARCHCIALLYQGRIIAEGSPAEIMAKTATGNLDDAFLVLAAEGRERENA